MTENSVPNPHPTPQPSTPPAVELSWDDIADGNFPPTRQQRLLQAALQATELLKEQPDVPLTQDRLTKALDLVLSNAVLLYPDNTASVNSGSRRYTVANGSCTCAAAKHSGPMCKHQLAVHIHQRAMALLQDTPAVAANEAAPTAAAVAAPSTPASAQWDVREAQTSCYLEFRVPSLKLGYTIRGATDPEVLTRLTQYLPTLQDIIEGYEERSAARQAARQATKADAATPQTQQAVEAPLPSSPAELQQLIQQTLQQAMAAQGSGPAAANGQPPTSVPPVAPPQGLPAETPEGYCALHAVHMELRNNANGSWYSHLETDEAGDYFCKGKGRPRSNGR